jgi:hypothetical protein
VHRLSSSFILAYHGCDRAVAENLLQNKPFQVSENDYDWLGFGCLFLGSQSFEGSGAKQLKKVRTKSRSRIKEPYAIGTVIDLGYCLDLISTTGIEFVKGAYAGLRLAMDESETPMPRNCGGDDLLQRHLDCAVINYVHSTVKLEFAASFWRGNPFTKHRGFARKPTSRSASAISKTSKAYSASLSIN